MITEDLEKIKVIQEGLSEADLISGIVETTEVANRVHVVATVGSISLDALIDNGSLRTLIRQSTWEQISRVSGKELDSNARSRIIMANGSTDLIVGKVNLPITIDGMTRTCEVRVAANLDTELVLGLDSQGKFDMVFASRSRTVFMPDITDKYYPLKQWLIAEEGCSGVIAVMDEEEVASRDFLERKLPPKLKTPLGSTPLIKHTIDVQGHTPIKERYRIMSPKVQEAFYKEVDRLLEQGIIAESFSEWSAPIVMALKSDGNYRLCLDFGKLNSVSKKDAYPLPYVSDILRQLKAAKYISKIDLSWAFNQIPLDEASQ